jgi:tetratricopeptide (TPR) repeat protein
VFWNPLLADGHWVAARHALAHGLWVRAREQLGAAFRCDPRPDRLELALASLARRSGEEEEILVHLSQALEERPHSAGVRFALGLEYARQGYLVEAAGQLSAAWRLPGWHGRTGGTGAEIPLAGPSRDARRNFRQALRLGDPPRAEVRLGYLCLLLGLRRHEEALQQAEILNKEAGESADLLYCRGEALAGVGSSGGAAACVTRALQLGGSRRIAFDLLDLVCRAHAGIQQACVPEGS